MNMLLVGGYCPREDDEDSLFFAWFRLLSQAEVVAKQVAREAPIIVPMKTAKPRIPALFGGLIGLSRSVSWWG